MHKLPLVSICIPTYNGAAFLQEALDSVIAQTYTNLEVIVSDDASVDDTMGILERFRDSVSIPVHMYTHTPSGIGANWNNTLRHANGEFIKFLFQDDVLSPNCIENMMDLMLEHSNLGLVGCKRSFIKEIKGSEVIETWIKNYGNLQAAFENNEEVTFLTKEFIRRKDFFQSPLNKIGEPPTTLFRKSVLKKTGFFDEDLEQILDYTFYYRLLKHYDIAIINEPLVSFRIHENQATQVNSRKTISDYERYDEILYTEFYTLLHPEHKKRLRAKFSPVVKFKNAIKKKLKGLLRYGHS